MPEELGTIVASIQDSSTGNILAVSTAGAVSVAGVFVTSPTLLTNGTGSTLQLDSYGALYVNTEGRRPSYKASVTFTLAASSTDVFTVYGSATKTIRVQELFVTGTNTGNTNALVAIIKRSTADTGGTSTTATNVPLDSANAAGTAVVKAYTANPSLGATVGTLDSQYVFLPVLASTNGVGSVLFDYGDDNEQACTLRGTSEGIAVNMNIGGLLPGTTVLSVTATWTEE